MKIEIKGSISGARITHSIFELTSGNVMRRSSLLLILIAFLMLINPGRAVAQQGNITLFGDVKIDDSKADTPGPSTVTIILYDRSLRVVGRQNVSTRGRYRFTNLRRDEDYEIVVEAGDVEIARVRLNLLDPSDIGIRQDFEFEWKSKSSAASKQMNGVISAADIYNRSSPNKSLFQKAQDAAGKKKYDQAVTFLRQILESDKLDFPVWTLLGTLYLAQEKTDDAEKAYLSALEAKPSYVLALINLGRLRASQKRFDQAIEPLTHAVELRPQSGEANLLLGEAYLQIRKGSKAIPYLDEAARLGRAEAHLRLAWLYNAAGLKDKAVVEYEQFLKKSPDYAERKKLEDYIKANRKG
jgi:tetratricopeptide (TPR) repeat protein